VALQVFLVIPINWTP